MWFDTNLAFRRLDTTMADQWPSLSLFLNFVELAFANFNNMCFIVYSHYKNTSIRYCEEYKISPDPKNYTVSWTRTQFWIFLNPPLYEILFTYYYRFNIAANTSSLGVFLYICIICRYMYFYKQWTDRLFCDCMTHTGASLKLKKQGRIV